MRIPSDAPASIQAAFREVWNELQKPRDIDLKGNRITNAGPGLIGSEYVTRRQMKEYVRSQEFAADVTNITVNGGGSGGTHGLLSPTHYDANPAGATRGDLIVANSAALWSRFAVGSSGQVLLGGTDPSWGTSLATLTFTTSEVIQTPQGATATYGYTTEEITLTGGTTDSAANLLPVGSLLLGVTGRVTQTITRDVANPTQFQVGDATTAARFATSPAVTSGTTFIGGNHLNGSVTTDAAGPTQGAAAKVRITINGTGNVTAGKVRVVVNYIQFSPPTS